MVVWQTLGANTIRGHDDDGGSSSRFFHCAETKKDLITYLSKMFSKYENKILYLTS